LILVEVKAAQFRFESQLGDLGRLRSDLQDNILDAFEQARRAASYIQSTADADFTEKASGRILHVQRDKIQRLYMMTVSLHHLAGLATRLASLRPFGFFKDGEYPWALSVADLDILTQFCAGPDVFLHYAERRLAVQKETVDIHADELDLFGAYLQTRLQAERIWERGRKRPNFVTLMGFQEQFDAVMEYRRGHREQAPQVCLKIPPEIAKILEELRNYDNDENARWIAFCLLTLSDAALAAVARMFIEVLGKRVTPGKFIFTVHSDSNIVISLTATSGLPAEMLNQAVSRRTALEKYRRKASKSIGFGVLLSESSKPFDCIVWAEEPWSYNSDLERIIRDEPAIVPIEGSKLPGRNDPCVCGSGRKFKKCCQPKIEAVRRR
jgi:hypothetical protein